MRPILMDNAFEAWAVAIRYCNDIKDGKATLQYQKSFVSSLHNAVELIMKQMSFLFIQTALGHAQSQVLLAHRFLLASVGVGSFML